MDYNGFLNFVLAIENCQDHQALRYLFKIFDIKNQGYLDSFTIMYFIRVTLMIILHLMYAFKNN